MQFANQIDQSAWIGLVCLLSLIVGGGCSFIERVAAGGSNSGPEPNSIQTADITLRSPLWATPDGDYRVVLDASHPEGVEQVKAVLYEEACHVRDCNEQENRLLAEQVLEKEHGRWVGEMHFETDTAHLRIGATADNDHWNKRSWGPIERDDPADDTHVVFAPDDLTEICEAHCPVITGKLIADAVPGLENLDGLQELTRFEGRLLIEDNVELESLAGLGSLQDVDKLDIHHNRALDSLDGLASLETIEFRLRVANHANLKRLTDIDVESVEGAVTIRGNDDLGDISGFEGLVSTGSLALQDNSSLGRLAGLENLKEVARLTIRRHESLSSIDALDGLERVEDVRVVENPELDPCAVDALVDGFETTPATATLPEGAEDC